MKKILLILLILFVFQNEAEARDIYPFVVTTDSANFTTNAKRTWRWLETRVHLGTSNAYYKVVHTIVNRNSTFHDTVISVATVDTITQDTVIYPGQRNGSGQLIAPGEVYLTNTDELKVQVSGHGSNTPYITIVGEEL